VDYFPRTRGMSTLASPPVIANMLRELVVLYRETKHPQRPSRPVRSAKSPVVPMDAARRIRRG
ncbi:MAG TPA: glycosyltransferase family 2 protein, partial [Myxococcaceae bacterium]|nr:glycosyltransferase family 2 protein [Myxococcaceae bacterium]